MRHRSRTGGSLGLSHNCYGSLRLLTIPTRTQKRLYRCMEKRSSYRCICLTPVHEIWGCLIANFLEMDVSTMRRAWAKRNAFFRISWTPLSHYDCLPSPPTPPLHSMFDFCFVQVPERGGPGKGSGRVHGEGVFGNVSGKRSGKRSGAGGVAQTHWAGGMCGAIRIKPSSRRRANQTQSGFRIEKRSDAVECSGCWFPRMRLSLPMPGVG